MKYYYILRYTYTTYAPDPTTEIFECIVFNDIHHNYCMYYYVYVLLYAQCLFYQIVRHIRDIIGYREIAF